MGTQVNAVGVRGRWGMSSRREFRTLDRVAVSQRTRPDAPAPVTIDDLVELFARALDEGPAVSRLHR